ncbi:MAG: type II toxin-antitoxin system HipA family toxin [Gammaproteobacteria bacterium]
MTMARVNLWGRQIGAVVWDAERELGVFQYTDDFVKSGFKVSPITMPPNSAPYSFPGIAESFRGLPGLLADCLPDKFGHRVIDAWLATQGRLPGSMNPVERLCYIGQRAMGALEFEPTTGTAKTIDQSVNIAALTKLANEVLTQREVLVGQLGEKHDAHALQDILRVGTSAGGARAKALLAWNPSTGEFRSGQLKVGSGFEHWLLKFDGIGNNSDKELSDPQGYGRIEYAYHLMAMDAGIEMTRCRLHHEGGRSHFMTKRFERTETGKKLHMQSLAALCHYDYDDPASYSYEQAMLTIRQISSELAKDCQQQFARAVFNVVARNQDDHVKNIAFLMNSTGQWVLSPAFDVVYAWNPNGAYTGAHQMSINGKRDNFVLEDLLALASSAGIKAAKAKQVIERVIASVKRWPQFAEQAGVEPVRSKQIANAHRVLIKN